VHDVMSRKFFVLTFSWVLLIAHALGLAAFLSLGEASPPWSTRWWIQITLIGVLFGFACAAFLTECASSASHVLPYVGLTYAVVASLTLSVLFARLITTGQPVGTDLLGHIATGVFIAGMGIVLLWAFPTNWLCDYVVAGYAIVFATMLILLMVKYVLSGSPIVNEALIGEAAVLASTGFLAAIAYRLFD